MNIVIGFDIGGTHSRAVIAEVKDGGCIPHPAFPALIDREVASKGELRAFIRGLLGRLADPDRLLGVVIALAGPVIHRRTVTMTNWPGSERITLEEFVEWGLPPRRTTLINDMEAGCYGLIKHLHENGMDARYFEHLNGSGASSPPALGGNHLKGNKIFIAPGTGLGAAGIIELEKTPEAPPLVYPIPTELQHTPMPILQAEYRGVADRLRRERQITHPSWDDIVSGRGLAGIYRALLARAGNGPPDEPRQSIDPAGENHRKPRGAAPADGTPTNGADVTLDAADPAAAIAEAGVAGRDPIAEEALSLFYECTGRFCQLMALGFQAFGGVFLGGTSTMKNRDFIIQGPSGRDGARDNARDNAQEKNANSGPLLEAFLDNPAQRPLLAQFPIYLVGKDDLNMDGALWLGHNLS